MSSPMTPPEGQPRYGPPQYGQQQYGQQQPQQPQYGQPQYAGYGQAPGQDPGVVHAQSGMISIPRLGTVKVASFGQRAAARILDSVILAVVFGVLYAVAIGGLVASSSGSQGPSGVAIGGLLVLMLVGLVVSLIYEPVLTALRGATLGKQLMGIKVVMPDGALPTWGASIVRWLVPNVASFFTCGLGGIVVLLSPLFDNSGRFQGWHDKAARTLVVSSR